MCVFGYRHYLEQAGSEQRAQLLLFESSWVLVGKG